MIGDAYAKLLVLPLIVVLAFIFFCIALVVTTIGLIDPHSTAQAELSKLATGCRRIERAWRAPIA